MHQSCQPGVGRTYLTIGQDYFSIQEYVLSQYNASLHIPSTRPLSSFSPAATMFYTDLKSLQGLDIPADYGSGIEYADGLVQAFPNSGLQIGLWLDGTSGCRDVVVGLLDDKIQSLFQYLHHVKTPKVFLRVGYEFDNPYFGYSDDPSLYQEAFRKLVRDCEHHLSKRKCHNKIAFVWHSWGGPRKEVTASTSIKNNNSNQKKHSTTIVSLDDFYPGDEYVDWVGVSIFQQLYPWANMNNNDGDDDDNESDVYAVDDDDDDNDFAGGSLAMVEEVLNLAVQLDKPIMIAESTPFGGIYLADSPYAALVTTTTTTTTTNTKKTTNTEHTGTKKSNSTTTTTYGTDDENNGDNIIDIWKLWFQPTIDLIEKYDIDMWSYINCNWNEQPMWSGVGFGDSRIATSKHVMERWQREVLNNQRFQSYLDCSNSNGNTNGNLFSTQEGGSTGTPISSSSLSSSSSSTITDNDSNRTTQRQQSSSSRYDEWSSKLKDTFENGPYGPLILYIIVALVVIVTFVRCICACCCDSCSGEGGRRRRGYDTIPGEDMPWYEDGRKKRRTPRISRGGNEWWNDE